MIYPSESTKNSKSIHIHTFHIMYISVYLIEYVGHSIGRLEKQADNMRVKQISSKDVAYGI